MEYVLALYAVGAVCGTVGFFVGAAMGRSSKDARFDEFVALRVRRG